MNQQQPKPTAHEREPTQNKTTSKPQSPTKPLALTLDVEAYLSQLEDWEMSEEEKLEFIACFWELLLSFAQIGFDIHPAQEAQRTGCKKPKKPPENSQKSAKNAALSSPDMLYSKPYISTHINPNSAAALSADDRDSMMEGAQQ